MDQQVVDMNGGIAKVQTELGLIELNLTSLNATLDDMFLYVKAINGTTATIETTIGAMNGTITSLHDNLATILVPGVGQIKADVSGFKQTREIWAVTQYATLAIVAVAAAGAIVSTILLSRRRKPPESTTNL